MTISTKYSIGDYVWHAEGVYAIPVQVRVKDILASFDEFGVLIISYGFGDRDWRIVQDYVFISEQACQESVNNQL